MRHAVFIKNNKKGIEGINFSQIFGKHFFARRQKIIGVLCCSWHAPAARKIFREEAKSKMLRFLVKTFSGANKMGKSSTQLFYPAPVPLSVITNLN